MTLTATLTAAATNLDALPADVLATVVETNTPTTGVHITTPLLVTRTERMRLSEVGDDGFQPQSWPDYHGRVVEAAGANTSYRGWVLRNTPNGSVRVFGAPVNPEPIVGHFYRIIASDGGANYLGSIAQYVGPGHGIVWRLVQRHDGLPVVQEDGWQTWDWNAHVEVRDPSLPLTPVEDFGDLLEDTVPVVEDTVGIPTVTPTHLSEQELPRNIRAYTVYEDTGHGALLNPEPVIGGLYAVWWHVPDLDVESVHIAAAVAMQVPTGFSRVGWINRYGFESETYAFDFASYSTGEMRWVEIKSQRDVNTSPTPAESVAAITEATEQHVTTFDGMLDALHTMADNKGWCQEYEEVMHRGGMVGRPRYEQPAQHAYNIEIYASFSATNVRVSSSGVDEALSEALDITVSDVSYADFTGSHTFTIEGVIAATEDEARQSIEADLVREELNQCIDFTIDSLDGWNIQDINEDTNYDFNN